jgi:hypothetical protein
MNGKYAADMGMRISVDTTLTCATLLIVKKSVINMGIKMHDNLPSELKRIENFKVFKNTLKSNLL